MATLKDGTITVAGRTSDGTKLNKVIYSPNKSLVGKFVDSENLNKWSLGGTPTFYGNSLGMASWHQTVATPPIPGANPAPTAPASGSGGYSVQSTNGGTAAPAQTALGMKSQVDAAYAKMNEAQSKINPMDPTSLANFSVAMGEYSALKAAYDKAYPNVQMGPTVGDRATNYETAPASSTGMTPAQMAAKIFPNDTNAQQAFVKSWNEGLVYEQQGLRDRAATERAALTAGNQTMTNPLSWLNDFLTNNPTGQVLAPILENGVGVTIGAGPGSSTGTTTPTQPDWDSVIDQAVNNYTPPPTTINGGTPNSGTIVNGTPVLNNPVYTPSNPGGSASGGNYDPTTGDPGNFTGNNSSPTAPATNTTTTPTVPTTPAPTTGTPSTGAGAASSLLPAWFTPELAAIITSGGLGVVGANQAAQAQKEATDKILAAQKAQYDQTRADWAPWRDAGAGAINDLKTFWDNNPDFDMSKFQADPGYSFRLNEGMKALQNSAAARGNLLSGNTLKGIQNYGQEAASQEYNNAFNRYNTNRGAKLNHLQSLAGMNQTAIQQTNQAGQNYANNAGSAYTDAGNATASGWVGGTNALTNALSDYTKNNRYNNYINALGGY